MITCDHAHGMHTDHHRWPGHLSQPLSSSVPLPYAYPILHFYSFTKSTTIDLTISLTSGCTALLTPFPFSPSTSVSSHSSTLPASLFHFIARKCRYAKLCFGLTAWTTFIGGLENHSTSFVTGSRSKCLAERTRTSVNHHAPKRESHPPVSGGNISIDKWLSMAANPPITPTTDRSLLLAPTCSQRGAMT